MMGASWVLRWLLVSKGSIYPGAAVMAKLAIARLSRNFRRFAS